MSDAPAGAAQPIDIVGLHGGQWFGRDAEEALRRADVLIGHARQLAVLASWLPGERVELWGDLDEVLGFAAARRASGQRACILASGDPGFFGLVRLAAARLGSDSLRVFPAPSSVSLAFARVGCNWDDALVVSAHGRPLTYAADAVQSHPKVAVLVSKDQPPELLGKALLDRECGSRHVVVCSRLGEADERVVRTDLAGLATGCFDPLSVVVLRAPDAFDQARGGPDALGQGVAKRGASGQRIAKRGASGHGGADDESGHESDDESGHESGHEVTGQQVGPGVAWGLPESSFAHRDGMITKAEVRAVVLGKLALPPTGVLWDVGAGSGSVAIECAMLAPGLRVFAVEGRADDAARLRDNVHAVGLAGNIRVIEGIAPQAFADLPDPDRVFVGGGGLVVLDGVLDRLRPDGAVVATYAVLANAAAAAERLGNLVQMQVSRGVAVGESEALRLAAENPVFVCWGGRAGSPP